MRAGRVAFLIFMALVLQTTLLSEITVFGVRGDVILLLGIAAAIVGGPEVGATVGFVGGLAFDALVQTPFGLTALVCSLTGYVVGLFQGSVLRAVWWIPVGSACAASALAVVGYALIGEVLGQAGFLGGDLIRIAVVVALINGALVLPAIRSLRWALPSDLRSSRVGLRL